VSDSGAQGWLFPPTGEVGLVIANEILERRHYLGAVSRGRAWIDSDGVIVVCSPTSRLLPEAWLEVSRWCLFGNRNGGSKQWARVRKWIAKEWSNCSTIVSYSDPSQGHTGSLYRSCGWLWAPTWHRLRPPPSGNGNWGSGQQGVKDRWVYVLREDPHRANALAVRDPCLVRKMPWCVYKEPAWKRRRAVPGTGGGEWRRWSATA